MIIRCPECSTGFRLSDDRVSEEPVKVRCSKCEHVFKAGLVEGEPTLFDTSDQPLPDEKQRTKPDRAAEGDGPDGAPVPDEEFDGGSATQMGTPAAGHESDAEDGPAPESDESSEDSDYNPFPHAGSEAQPNTSSAISGGDDEAQDPALAETAPDDATDEDQSQEEEPQTAGSVSVNPDAATAPPEEEFEGEATAVGEAPDDTSSGAAQAQTGGSESTTADATTTSGAETTSSGSNDSDVQSGAAETSGSAQTGGSSATSGSGSSRGGGHAPPDGGAASSSASADSSGTAGPNRTETSTDTAGTTSTPESASAGGSGDTRDHGADPPSASSGGTAGTATGSAAPAAGTSSAQSPGKPSSPAQSGSSPSSTSPSEPVGDAGLGESSSIEAEDELALGAADPAASASFGSSRGSKIAYGLLALVLVANGFLAFVASQNGWFLDFRKFGQMFGVAFQGAEYTPRDEWTQDQKVIRAPKPDNPIEFRNVFAQTVTLEKAADSEDEKPQVLVIRGDAENVSNAKHLKVEIRGVVLDRTGKVVTQAKAPLGGDIAPKKIASAESTAALAQLQPSKPGRLAADDSKPFTIIFESVPAPVRKGVGIDYRIELADSFTPGSSGP